MTNEHGLTLYVVKDGEKHWIAARSEDEARRIHIASMVSDEEQEIEIELMPDGPMLDKQMGGDAEPGVTLRSAFLETRHPGVLASTVY